MSLRKAGVIHFTRMSLLGYVMVFGGLLTGSVGDIAAYWGGSDTKTLNPLQGVGFGIETLAILAVCAGSFLLGQAAKLVWWQRWLLYLMLPAAISGGIITGYIPHGLMLPITLIWALIGLFQTGE